MHNSTLGLFCVRTISICSDNLIKRTVYCADSESPVKSVEENTLLAVSLGTLKQRVKLYLCQILPFFLFSIC